MFPTKWGAKESQNPKKKREFNTTNKLEQDMFQQKDMLEKKALVPIKP